MCMQFLRTYLFEKEGVLIACRTKVRIPETVGVNALGDNPSSCHPIIAWLLIFNHNFMFYLIIPFFMESNIAFIILPDINLLFLIYECYDVMSPKCDRPPKLSSVHIKKMTHCLLTDYSFYLNSLLIFPRVISI